MKNDVCIVGLGYVGLTFAVVLAEKGFNIIGIDKSREIVEGLRKKEPHFFETGVKELLQKYGSDSLLFQDFYRRRLPETTIICVSTPVDPATHRPSLDNLIKASEEIGKKLGNGALVIVRSTVPVGTSRKIVLPRLLKSGKEVKLAFCPERTIQGQALKELKELPQIIGGLNEESAAAAENFFK